MNKLNKKINNNNILKLNNSLCIKKNDIFEIYDNLVYNTKGKTLYFYIWKVLLEDQINNNNINNYNLLPLYLLENKKKSLIIKSKIQMNHLIMIYLK